MRDKTNPTTKRSETASLPASLIGISYYAPPSGSQSQSQQRHLASNSTPRACQRLSRAPLEFYTRYVPPTFRSAGLSNGPLQSSIGFLLRFLVVPFILVLGSPLLLGSKGHSPLFPNGFSSLFFWVLLCFLLGSTMFSSRFLMGPLHSSIGFPYVALHSAIGFSVAFVF